MLPKRADVDVSQNLEYDFPKMRGGVVKGRLELFRKCIRFSSTGLPLASVSASSKNLNPYGHWTISIRTTCFFSGALPQHMLKGGQGVR